MITVYGGTAGETFADGPWNGLCLAQAHEDRIAACAGQTERKRRRLGCMLTALAFYEHTGGNRLPAFSYGADGKPFLAKYPDFCFNISHSGEFAVCAVSEHAVGVDLQQIRPVSDQLAARFFSAREKEWLGVLAGAERERGFFRLWSAKEAYVKYTGRGMGQGFGTFTAELAAGEVLDAAENSPLAYLTELALPAGPDYLLTVCSAQKDAAHLRKKTLHF